MDFAHRRVLVLGGSHPNNRARDASISIAGRFLALREFREIPAKKRHFAAESAQNVAPQSAEFSRIPAEFCAGAVN